MSFTSCSSSPLPSVKAELESVVEELNALFSSPLLAALSERASATAAREDADAHAHGRASAAQLAKEAKHLEQMNRLADYLEGLGGVAEEEAVLAELEQALEALPAVDGLMDTKEARERRGGEERACALLARLL